VVDRIARFVTPRLEGLRILERSRIIRPSRRGVTKRCELEAHEQEAELEDSTSVCARSHAYSASAAIAESCLCCLWSQQTKIRGPACGMCALTQCMPRRRMTSAMLQRRDATSRVDLAYPSDTDVLAYGGSNQRRSNFLG
jgi:hypothetical protein